MNEKLTDQSKKTKKEDAYHIERHLDTLERILFFLVKLFSVLLIISLGIYFYASLAGLGLKEKMYSSIKDILYLVQTYWIAFIAIIIALLYRVFFSIVKRLEEWKDIKLSKDSDVGNPITTRPKKIAKMMKD